MFHHPEDLGLRLEYAAYLENIDPMNAEFIRIEVELATGPRKRGDAQKERRASEICYRYRGRWDARIFNLLRETPIGGEFGKHSHSRKMPLAGWRYGRGCIETVVMPVWGIRRYLGCCFECGPVHHLIVRSKTELSRADRLAEELGDVAELRFISRLEFPGAFGTPDQWTKLLLIPPLVNLEHVILPPISLDCAGQHKRAGIELREFVRRLFKVHANLKYVENHRSNRRDLFSREKFMAQIGNSSNR